MFELIKISSQEELSNHFKQIKPYIQKVIDRFPEFSITHLLREILTGVQCLFIITEDSIPIGFVTTKVKQYPEIKSLLIYMLGGEKLHQWADMVNDELEAQAKEAGCTRIELNGRKGWLPFMSKLGYVNKSICMHKELGE